MGRPGQTQTRRMEGFLFSPLVQICIVKRFFFCFFLFIYFLTQLFSAMGFIGRMFEWSNKEWRMCKKFFFSFCHFWRWPRHWGLVCFSSHSRRPLLLLRPRPPREHCPMSITEKRNNFSSHSCMYVFKILMQCFVDELAAITHLSFIRNVSEHLCVSAFWAASAKADSFWLRNFRSWDFITFV